MRVIHWFPLKKIQTFPTWIIDNQFKKKKNKITAYYSLDKYFNKEIKLIEISTQVIKKKHISNRGSIIINIGS